MKPGTASPRPPPELATPEKRSFILQSHRGAGTLSTDNTRAAFLLGWELETIPEADVRTTRDGVLVAFHDDDFARVLVGADATLVTKGVGDIDWATLSGFDVGSWRGAAFAGERVPRLAEVFKMMNGHPEREIYLDIKEVSLERLAREVEAAGVQRQVIVASSDYAVLREWNALQSGAGRTLYWMGTWGDEYETPLRERFSELRSHDFAAVSHLQVHASLRLPLEKIHRDTVDPFSPSDAFFRETASELKERGILFQSLPWGGSSEAVYAKLLDLGVESFATDYPDVTLAAMRAWKPQPRRAAAVERALAAADETRALVLGAKVLDSLATLYRKHFGDAPAMIVEDDNTHRAAGEAVAAILCEAGVELAGIWRPQGRVLADYDHVERLVEALRPTSAIAIAVGSGTLNDLTKLASAQCGRSYLTVATAASMDGYTASGASITCEGHKQTMPCPAPRAVLADVEVIAAAPPAMAASGYADLMAKLTAGADWLLADALGVEPIDTTAWTIVQEGLAEALADPSGVARGGHGPLLRLTEGLMLGGFAMQRTKTSRVASGAEHQFSHLWDMQHHTFEGVVPSHGNKVGIGTLAVTALYEWLLAHPLETLDVAACVAAWPKSPVLAVEDTRQWNDTLVALAQRELEAKWVSRGQLENQLTQLRAVWPSLRARLQKQLIPFDEMKRRLRDVGAPVEPEEIGISRERLRSSFIQAQAVRRRFTVLDLAVRIGLLHPALDTLFGPRGPWPVLRTGA